MDVKFKYTSLMCQINGWTASAKSNLTSKHRSRHPAVTRTQHLYTRQFRVTPLSF